MNGVRMRAVEFGRAGHVGGHEMNLLAAQPPEVVVERYRRTTLGGQEEFRKHKERRRWRRNHRPRSQSGEVEGMRSRRVRSIRLKAHVSLCRIRWCMT